MAAGESILRRESHMEMHDGIPVAAWVLAHAAGIGLALFSRLALEGPAQRASQFALSVGLIAVAGIALATDLTASLAWVASAATLGVMVIAAVWEPIHHPHDPMLVRILAGQD